MSKEYIEREALIKEITEYCDNDPWGFMRGPMEAERRKRYFKLFRLVVQKFPAADVVEVDRLGRVGRLMLPYNGCPRGPMGRLGMAGGKTQDKKAILVEELCCMDTFEDVDGNVWRPVQEEVLQEVIEILRKEE